MTKLIFLPGASGRKAMWKLWVQHFEGDHKTKVLGWPGLDNEPEESSIQNISDLSHLVIPCIEKSSVLIAQSMGGVVALHAFLKAKDLIAAMVLFVTSGGLNRSEFDCEDWRPEFVLNNPEAPKWFVDDEQDLGQNWSSITVPVLLIWGSNDWISPITMGQKLNDLIPNSSLVIVDGAGHDVAETHARQLLPIVTEFLKQLA